MTKAILCENSEGGVAITVVEERTINTPKGAFQVTLAGELERMAKLNPTNTYTVVDEEVVDKKYAESPFRGAWKTDLSTDIAKAKELVHAQRKAKRSEQFAPLDVEATVPVLAEAAEAKRQVIRDENAVIQTAVNKATTEAALITQLKKVM
tara:strand:- start:90 stop:542 length:453 start_codon:yes stop_codon:yes gene_type:complete